MIAGWVQKDAPQLVRDRLRRVVDDPDRVRAQEMRWTPDDPPYVTVQSDGTPVSSRGWTSELVRITVYAADRVQARRLMAFLDGYIAGPRAAGIGLSIRAATGLILTNDSRHGGGFIASATYQVATNRTRRMNNGADNA